MENILEQIKHYNAAYRAGTPEISDTEYDALVDELRRIDPTNEWFAQIEPVEVNASRKRKLPIPMKSLNKIKNFEELQKWLRSLAIPDTAKVVIMPKYDGVSWLHDERNNKTYSRGGSENEGQDCSTHFKKGGFIQNEHNIFINPKYTFGELVFAVKDWKMYFAGQISPHTGEPYRSPRNTIAGLINRDEASTNLAYATFMRYGIDEASLEHGEWNTFSGMLNDLSAMFLQPELYKVVKISELSDKMLHEAFQDWSKLFYIDGLVIYLNDLLYWQVLGRQQTSGNPLYAIAYKNPNFTETFQTTVKGIEWNVSKSGALKPVVIMDAVDTGDCIMESPTGYNARWIANNDIAPGAEILVTRSGGVIPKILKTITPAPAHVIERQNMELAHCPVCGAPTKYDENGVELCCSNPKCEGRQLAKAIHFFNTVGVENIGEETFAKIFVEHPSIKEILDISAQSLFRIDGFGDSTTNMVLSEMKKIKQCIELATLIHASDCFKGIGKIKAEKFLESLSKDEISAFASGAFSFSDSGSNVTEQSFYNGYNDFVRFVRDIDVPIILPSEKKAPSGSKYKNCFICFSGVRDRELEAVIIDGGGTIVSGVSKKTTHLVVKDINASSTKIEKAKSLSIPIFTLDSFRYL